MEKDNNDIWQQVDADYQAAIRNPDFDDIGSNRVPECDPSYVESGEDVSQCISHSVRHSMM